MRIKFHSSSEKPPLFLFTSTGERATGNHVTITEVSPFSPSIAGKILARLLLNRLIQHLEQDPLLPESQCGFRASRGTVDMIFAARQLQKCQEQNSQLYTTFVDLTKAFDTISRDGLWKIMKKFKGAQTGSSQSSSTSMTV